MDDFIEKLRELGVEPKFTHQIHDEILMEVKPLMVDDLLSEHGFPVGEFNPLKLENCTFIRSKGGIKITEIKPIFVDYIKGTMVTKVGATGEGKSRLQSGQENKGNRTQHDK